MKKGVRSAVVKCAGGRWGATKDGAERMSVAVRHRLHSLQCRKIWRQRFCVATFRTLHVSIEGQCGTRRPPTALHTVPPAATICRRCGFRRPRRPVSDTFIVEFASELAELAQAPICSCNLKYRHYVLIASLLLLSFNWKINLLEIGSTFNVLWSSTSQAPPMTPHQSTEFVAIVKRMWVDKTEQF